MRKSKYENKFKIGDKFGKWTILNANIAPHPDNTEATILCKCECKHTEYIRCLTLINKKSTGCFNCGHNKRGKNHHLFKGYKEIPGSWFIRYTNRSKKWEFNITIEDIYDLWVKQNKKCALSRLDIDFINLNPGNPDRRSSKYDLICTASLDRIDSNKGYTLNNIQLVHKDINIMKNEYDQDYFIYLCQLVTKNN
jgi:hypothetical protein